MIYSTFFMHEIASNIFYQHVIATFNDNFDRSPSIWCKSSPSYAYKIAPGFFTQKKLFFLNKIHLRHVFDWIDNSM